MSLFEVSVAELKKTSVGFVLCIIAASLSKHTGIVYKKKVDIWAFIKLRVSKNYQIYPVD